MGTRLPYRFASRRMILEPVDPNERFRARRRQARRRLAIRRTAVVGVVVLAAGGIALGARSLGGGEGRRTAGSRPTRAPTATPAAPAFRARPSEIRGVHVTMALASLQGRLARYMDMSREGLNTIELDVKDENGEVGFVSPKVRLAAA